MRPQTILVESQRAAVSRGGRRCSIIPPTRGRERCIWCASRRPNSPRCARSPASPTSRTSSSIMPRARRSSNSRASSCYLALVPQSLRVPRGRDGRHRPAPGRRNGAQGLRIGGYWYPRGGMPIDVFWQNGRAARRAVAARPGSCAVSRPRVNGWTISSRPSGWRAISAPTTSRSSMHRLHARRAGATPRPNSRGAHSRRALPRHRRGADRDHPAPHMLPGAEEFGAAMGALGVGRDDRIIVYDNSPLRTAARGWFMLRHFGAERVAMLDGGLAEMARRGPAGRSRRARHAARRALRRRCAARARWSTKAMLVASDARRWSMRAARPRFDGQRGRSAAGRRRRPHPRRRNLPLAALYRDDGTFESTERASRRVRRGGGRSAAAVHRQLRLGGDRQQPDLRRAPDRRARRHTL